MLRRLLPLFCAFLLILASSAFAAGPKTHLPGDLTMEEALAVQKAALEKAKAQGVPMNIAVVDAGGHLKTFVRQDGAFLGSIDVSIKKAVTARYFNMPTSALGAAAQPGKELFGIEARRAAGAQGRCDRRHRRERRQRCGRHQCGQGRGCGHQVGPCHFRHFAKRPCRYRQGRFFRAFYL